MATAKKQPVTIVKTLDTQEEKMKALQTALAEIEKNYGKGAVMKLGQGFVANVDSISTGSLGLDMALGIGGVPKGRIVEIFGHESSGKTTVSLQIVAQCQKSGGIAAFIDVEHALDPSYAKALGVNIDELLISQPDTGDQALEIAEHLIRSGAVDIIVVDSVAAMVPREEITNGMADSQVGLQARLMSKGMRKLAGVINKYKCCAIFINQIREMMGGQSFTGGPTTTTPGGRALKFFSTVRIEVNRAGAVKNNTEEQIGNRVRCKVVKNKVAPPFKIIEFDMIFGKGSSLAGEVLDYGETLGTISRSGAWYSYKDTRMGMGREQARAYLEENPEFMEKIVAELKENTDKFLLIYRKDGKPTLKEEKTAKGSKSAKPDKSEPSASSYDADIDAEPNEEDFE